MHRSIEYGVLIRAVFRREQCHSILKAIYLGYANCLKEYELKTWSVVKKPLPEVWDEVYGQAIPSFSPAVSAPAPSSPSADPSRFPFSDADRAAKTLGDR